MKKRIGRYAIAPEKQGVIVGLSVDDRLGTNVAACARAVDDDGLFPSITLGDKLRERWKQPVLVENKAGAGGMLGMTAVAKATTDGHTLGIGCNGPIAFGPHMYKKMAYDPAIDLLPVVMTSSQPNVLAVPASHPAKILPEFVTWAKKQGGKVNYASVGAGSSSHLTMELFKSVAGFEATHVPFAGLPLAGILVASDETQALFTVSPALLPLIQGGWVCLLASTSLKRDDLMKDLPTVTESGCRMWKDRLQTEINEGANRRSQIQENPPDGAA